MPRYSFFPPLIWLIITSILLTLPGSSLPKEDWLDKIWFDKWVHILLFFVLVVLWSYFLSGKTEDQNKRKNLMIAISILALLYGAGMEFVQKYFVRNREFDMGDIAANAIGCGLGLIFSLRRYIKK